MRGWSETTIKETGGHALVGGAVAAGLALFHLFIEKWVVEGPNWTWLLPALAAGAIVFAGIFTFEFLLKGTKVRLERIGKIDGYWIDAIYDAEKRLTRGAVIKIESSRATGFFIDGTSYRYERGSATKLREVGSFKGNGSASSEDGLTYYFTGHEGVLKKGEGLCHYIFSEHTASPGQLRFDGFFYSFVGNSLSYVKGRNITKAELGEFRQDKGEALLAKYLDSCAPTMPR